MCLVCGSACWGLAASFPQLCSYVHTGFPPRVPPPKKLGEAGLVSTMLMSVPEADDQRVTGVRSLGEPLVALQPGEVRFSPSARPGPGGCAGAGCTEPDGQVKVGSGGRLFPPLTWRGAFPRDIPQVTARQALHLVGIPGMELGSSWPLTFPGVGDRNQAQGSDFS